MEWVEVQLSIIDLLHERDSEYLVLMALKSKGVPIIGLLLPKLYTEKYEFEWYVDVSKRILTMRYRELKYE